jgi:hypothetical protein
MVTLQVADGIRPLYRAFRAPEALAYLSSGNRSGYKFYHSKDDAYFFAKPSIKIGTLSEYRQMEKQTTKDEAEGRSRLYIAGSHQLSTVHPTSRLHKYISVGPGSTIGDSVFESNFDFYTYCFSYKCSLGVLKSFNDKEPYDAVVQIRDPYGLAELITALHPVLRGWAWICAPVSYKQRTRGADDPGTGPFLEALEKDPSYSPNIEGRIIFTDRNRRIAPQLPPLPPWQHPALAGFYSRVALPLKPDSFQRRSLPTGASARIAAP